MLEIYSAETVVDAQLFKDLLESDGIEAIIKGGYLSGAAGELPASGLVSVWITDEIFDARARQLLVEFEAKQRQQQSDIFCGQCGNSNPGSFELCWSCGKPLKQINNI